MVFEKPVVNGFRRRSMMMDGAYVGGLASFSGIHEADKPSSWKEKRRASTPNFHAVTSLWHYVAYRAVFLNTHASSLGVWFSLPHRPAGLDLIFTSPQASPHGANCRPPTTRAGQKRARLPLASEATFIVLLEVELSTIWYLPSLVSWPAATPEWLIYGTAFRPDRCRHVDAHKCLISRLDSICS